MNFVALIFSWVLEKGGIQMFPGIVALAWIGYHATVEVSSWKEDLSIVVEQSLVTAITTADEYICMYPGDPRFPQDLVNALIAYEKKTHKEYPTITLRCARALGVDLNTNQN